MFKEQDFDMTAEMPWDELSLIQDLELNTLFSACPQHDFILEVVKSGFTEFNWLDTINLPPGCS
jgi:hypothetical protein